MLYLSFTPINQAKLLITQGLLANQRLLGLCVLTALAWYIVHPCCIWAEQSFQWVDKAGNTVYGSKPPADAKEVKEFKTRTLSTYSSEKAISRMEPLLETIAESEINQAAYELQIGPVKKLVIENSTDPVYSVEIKNPGTEIANSIKVTFRFSDAYVASASGPTTLGPNDIATYSLPAIMEPDIGPEETDFKSEQPTQPKSVHRSGEDLPSVEISYDLLP